MKKKKRQDESLLHDAKEEKLAVDGKIVETLPNGLFRVQIPTGHVILAHVSGKMRIRFIRLITGDRVRVEISPYDLQRGRIIYRLTEKE